MKIRILMVGPGEGIVGGISSLVEILLPVLAKRVDLLYVHSVKNREMQKSGKFSLRNIFGVLSQYSRFLIALIKFRPHIIHIHTSQGLGLLKDTFYMLMARINRRRILVHVHAAELNEFCGVQSAVVRSYIKKTLSLSDGIITVSEEWRKRLTNLIPKQNVLTFRNCVAVDSFPAPLLTDRFQRKMTVLFLGSIGARKGALDLLEAMGDSRLKNCSIQTWVAGYEERTGELIRVRTRLAELGLGSRYKLLGTVIGAKKIDLLRKANVFALPSYNEGLPMAVLEAMAAGLAIISTSVGGIPEVVKDGYNGFLIVPGDVDSLGEKLAVLAEDPLLCRSMGENSRFIAEHELDVKPYVQRLVALYESMLIDY